MVPTQVAEKDGTGKHHWREMLLISRSPQEKGFLDYQWMSPQGELKDKISTYNSSLSGTGLMAPGIRWSLIFQEAFYTLALKGMVAVVLSGLLFAMGYAISNNIIVPLNKHR
ncbi:hypothetical protein OK016_18720 [Vibrio chagasii]|nr:hypothetical protein [Vibrio chagasii]